MSHSLENNWAEEQVQWRTGVELDSQAYEEATANHQDIAINRVAADALDDLEEDWEQVEKPAKETQALGGPELLTFASVAGAAIYGSKIGATVAEAIGGIGLYMTAVPSTSGIWAQYFGALGAGQVSGSVLNFTIFGVSAAMASNAVAAAGGAYVAAKVVEMGYNRFYSKSDQDKVHINFTDATKQVASAILNK